MIRQVLQTLAGLLNNGSEVGQGSGKKPDNAEMSKALQQAQRPTDG